MPENSWLARFGPGLAIGGRAARPWFLLALTLALLAAFAFVYGRPVSISTAFVNDSLVFFDGIHRVGSGQSPHLDFSTPVGALSYWLPFAGYSVIGAYSGAVEVASLLLAAVILPMTAFLMIGRASAATAILVLGTLAGVIVVPLVPGWPPHEISHAMHYNRWGWGLILPLFLLALPPVGDGKAGYLRGVIGAALLIALFFIKITYFIYGSAFLLLLLAFRDARRRDGVTALAITALVMLAVLVFKSDFVFAYLADIRLALETGDAVRDSYLKVALTNRHALILMAIAIYAGLLKGNLTLPDFLVVGYVCLSGLAILDQNFQFTFIVSLVAAYALLASPANAGDRSTAIADSLIIALGFVMVYPFVDDWSRVSLAHLKSPPSGYAQLDAPGFEGWYAYDRRKPDENPIELDPATIDAGAYLRGEVPIQSLTETKHLLTLNDARRLLTETGIQGATLFTFDYTNSVPPLVDAPREANGYSWYHLGRNLSERTATTAEVLFADVDYVLAPIQTFAPDLSRFFLELYGSYFQQNLTEVARSDYWILFRNEGRQ